MNTSPSDAAKPRNVFIWVSVATLLGLIIRLYRLEYPVMWFDELWTYYFTIEPWDRLLGDLVTVDVHPPYYYLLQKAWLGWFGDTRTAMRTLPVLLGTACIPLMFILGRRLINEKVGLIAAFLLTTSPLAVCYSRELRMYSLLNASALIALVGLAYALPIKERSRPLLGWSVYILGVTSAFYAQTSAILLPALTTALLIYLLIAGHIQKRTIVEGAAANGIVLLAISPWLVIMANDMVSTLAQFWIPEPSLSWVKSQILGSYPYKIWLKPILYAAFVFGFFAVRSRLARLFALTFVVGQPLLMWLVSYARPVMIVKAMVWPTMAALVLPAALFARWRPALMIAATVAFMAFQALSLPSYYPSSRQTSDTAGLVAHLKDFDRAQDVVVLEALFFEADLRFERPDLFESGSVLAMTAGDQTSEFQPMYKSKHIKRAALAEATQGHRVWLITELKPRFETDIRPALTHWLTTRKEVERWTVGNLSLVVLEGAPPQSSHT